MSDFITEIKKFRADNLIYKLSEITISMFNDLLQTQNCIKSYNMYVQQYGVVKPFTVAVSPWDIITIEYLTIQHSNDYRKSKESVSMGEFFNSFRRYENEHSVAENIRKAIGDEVYRNILGITAEQFLFQNMYWIFEKFNRNYHVLVAGKDFEHRGKLDTETAVRETLGFSVDDYLIILLTIYWLCSKHPDPLSAPEQLYSKKESSILTKENLTKLVKFYSCSYRDIREKGRQIFYAKPFISTDREHAYLSSNLFLVAMILGNGLYWLVRDYYNSDKFEKQKFPNEFGLLFEDYIHELASTYCVPTQWRVISKEKNKSADFWFDFNVLQMIVESKSSIIGLDGKQQIPDIKTVDKFFENTIKKAYKQLNNSCKKAESLSQQIPIIKVILLYDEFSNTSIIELSDSDVFSADPYCFVMTIREFEILLWLNRYDENKCNEIFEQIIKQINKETEQKSIGAMYTELGITHNPHMEKEMDYFNQLMRYYADNLDEV